jgi:hypothetical protein
LLWGEQAGRALYPTATRLLVTADAGWSNSYRLWKTELARFTAATGLEVTVCHFPPGTSKWNKVEHRLFSHSSTNWRGRPLVSHEVIVELIAATRTSSGLRVRAELDPGRYPLGVKVSDRELAAVPLRRHNWHGEWNYTVPPAAASPPPAINLIARGPLTSWRRDGSGVRRASPRPSPRRPEPPARSMLASALWVLGEPSVPKPHRRNAGNPGRAGRQVADLLGHLLDSASPTIRSSHAFLLPGVVRLQ